MDDDVLFKVASIFLFPFRKKDRYRKLQEDGIVDKNLLLGCDCLSRLFREVGS